MDKDELLQALPTKRIKPVDGLVVTAQVWEEAHETHRQFQQAHTMLYHGSGVVTGLEVIASDPPDTSVYILPGVAIDPAGHSIILPQPVAYEIGDEMEGQLYLLLSYGESRPRASKGEEGPLYIHTEFSISARVAQPTTPAVELARILRNDRQAPFLNAPNPAQPGPNEIDLRFRREIGAPEQVSVAVCYLGKVRGKKHGRGLGFLAHALNRSGRYFVTVQDDVPLAPGIETHTLIYLVAEGNFELNAGQMNGLSNYVNRGAGTLFIEPLDQQAESAWLGLLHSMELEPQPIQFGHSLLVNPHLFAAPPPGFAGDDAPQVAVREGVILSSGNYGLLWQAETREGQPSRERLRAATEWGANLITYARNRRRRV